MEAKTFSYPRGMGYRAVLNIAVFTWLLASGVYFLAFYRLHSWQAYAGVAIVVAYFAAMAYVHALRYRWVSETFELSPRGVRISRSTREIAVVPWSEILEITSKGQYADLYIHTTVSPRPFRVMHYLRDFDQFGTTLRRLVAEWSPGAKWPRETGKENGAGYVVG